MHTLANTNTPIYTPAATSSPSTCAFASLQSMKPQGARYLLACKFVSEHAMSHVCTQSLCVRGQPALYFHDYGVCVYPMFDRCCLVISFSFCVCKLHSVSCVIQAVLFNDHGEAPQKLQQLSHFIPVPPPPSLCPSAHLNPSSGIIWSIFLSSRSTSMSMTCKAQGW
jgi:hypothetical protein